jgi:hypothetical protein
MAKKPKKSLEETVAEMQARRDMSSPEAFIERLSADERREKEGRKYKEEESARRSYGDLSGATFGKMETSPVNPPEAEFAMSGPSANSAADSAAARYRRGGMVKAKKSRSGRGDGCATRGFTKGKMY